MPNLISDTLFQLVKSLEKSEKRHFKLYIKRSSSKEDLKIIRLFDAMDKLTEYDEKHLLKLLPDITKPQLSNLKTHLNKQLLASLRLLKTNDNIDLKLSEHIHFGYSYDWTRSDINIFSNGSHEFMLNYRVPIRKIHGNIECPSYYQYR